MKRLWAALCAVAMLVGLTPAAGQAAAPSAACAATRLDPGPKVLLDGLPLEFEVPPAIAAGDRTMVPFRALAEALGAAITWEPDTQTILARGWDGTDVRLTICDSVMQVNGTAVQLDVPPLIVNSRTLIPLRAFSEAFHTAVGWDGTTRTVSMTSPRRPMQTLAFYAIRSYPELQYVPQFSDVAYGWSVLNGDGTVGLEGDQDFHWPLPDGDVTGEKLLADAAKAGSRRYLMVYRNDKDGKLSALVTDSKLTAAAATNIAATVKAKGFDGVVLDLEGLGPQDEPAAQAGAVRQGMTALVTAVAAQLRPAGKQTVVSVHPLNGWYLGYDYAALVGQADLLQVMAYDYQQDGRPEPADQVDQAIQMAIGAVGADRRSKLLLGINAPVETPETLKQKAGLAKRYGLGGVALWRLGLLGADRMAALNETIEPTKP